MTETEWLACDDPPDMLVFLRTHGTVNDRKWRLFAVACCRRIQHLLRDQRSREAVEAAENYAESCLDHQALERAAAAASEAIGGVSLHSEAAEYAATAAAWAASREQLGRTCEAAAVAGGAASSPEGWLPGKWDEQVWQSDLLRCIFGNLFRSPTSVAFSVLAWHDGCVVKLANAIYEEREFTSERMGILADALEDAGCDNADILNHCRQPGVHVRGCWAVDLLLGKE